jgi:hypothetical protein
MPPLLLLLPSSFLRRDVGQWSVTKTTATSAALTSRILSRQIHRDTRERHCIVR